MTQLWNKKEKAMSKMKSNLKNFLPLVGKSLQLGFQVNGAFSNVILLLGVIVAFMPVIVSSLFSNLSDNVQVLHTSKDKTLFQLVVVELVVIMLLKVVEHIHQMLQKQCAVKNAEKMAIHIRSEVMRCKCAVEYRYIEEHSDVFAKLAFINSFAVEKIAKNVQEVLGWAGYIITFFSLVFALATFKVEIVVLLLVSCIPSAIISYKNSSSDFNYKALHTDELALTIEYYRDLCYPYSFNEIRMFGILDYIKENLWKKETVKYNQATQQIMKRYLVINIVADLYRYAILGLALALTARSIFVSPLIGLGAFTLVYNMASQLQDVTTTLLTSVVNFSTNLQYSQSFFDLKDLPYEKESSENGSFKKPDIEFNHVNFRYAGSNQNALNDICLKIKNGEKIAIVGKNGSGKSTFINLLCGMYQPTSGTVKMGGVDIQQDVNKVRNSISPVFQDFGKYEFSILENITLSDLQRKVEIEEVDKITQMVGIDRFIAQQKHGYDEVVGSFSEEGNNLSGGQWQKIAIARALFRNRANIMVLDEPTSALDPIAEADIYRNFAGLTQDKTTLLVSHRLGICSVVDRILVFDKGRIVEDGTHEELMEKHGMYYDLYLAQAKWYV